MNISPEIKAFCSRRAVINVNCEVDEPVVADFVKEKTALLAEFECATTHCKECFGTDRSHYLSCSFWR